MQWWKYIVQAQIYYAMERIYFIRHTYIMQWYQYIFSGINILCNGTNIFIKTNINWMTILSHMAPDNIQIDKTRHLFRDRTISSPPSNAWQFASQRNQSTVITNAITDVIKRSTWIRSNFTVKLKTYDCIELTDLQHTELHPF